MAGGPAEAAKAFNNTRSDVGSRRIDHGIVISEGNVAEELAIVVPVERSPAPIAVLHTEQPLNTAANSAFQSFGVWISHALEGHQNESGVVDVWIKIIAKFKRPAAWFGVFILDLPVARAKHLLREHPIRGFNKRGMVGA